jgi:hypothetical protein
VVCYRAVYVTPLYSFLYEILVVENDNVIKSSRMLQVSTAFQEIFKNRIGSGPEQDLEALNNKRNDLIDAYNKGKLSNDQYTNLKDDASIAYEEIFSKRIINREDDLQWIQEDISDAYSKGKISILHYDLLNEKISKMAQKKEKTNRKNQQG